MGFPLELWGGVECTVNRVGNRFIDQVELSGHAGRPGDLDLFAGLGIRALRYPVLWERTAPNDVADADWAWADERLGRLRELGIRPIVGLVHHGSGPRHTSLVDPHFAEGLAQFARAVAERYPWVDAYTPVNEPLTTARFSGLYGHWYPHGRDDRTFVRALLAQCRAVVLSMRAIREVVPAAQLVQTDDLGKAFSTSRLAYQAAFENERRWVTFDLLRGRLDRTHPLWRWLRGRGVGAVELRWFVDNPCPPDILGINHYLSGQRFLDERLDRYPADSHGGNGRDAYADVLAWRVLREGADGPATLLREAWERYRLPIAVTETHNGCTREEQLRWLVEVWDAAEEVRRDGADIRAVTAWSLLGAYGWDTLVTRPDGRYEPGVFDLRGPSPRPTAIAGLLAALADGRRPDHPTLDGLGWWRRDERLLFPSVSRREAGLAPSAPRPPRPRPSPLLIVGPSATLTAALVRLCDLRGLAYHVGGKDLDPATPAAVEAAIRALRPWAVVHAAGYVGVDGADLSPELCERQVGLALPILADACARHGARLLAFSCDLVFDGTKRIPYTEADHPRARGQYGRAAASGEAAAIRALPSALVVRAGPLFGPWDGDNVVTAARRALAAGRPVVAPDDVVVSPTYVPDLVHAALDLLIDGAGGVWHLATPGALTWAELVRRAANLDGLDPRRVAGRETRRLGGRALRPACRALASERGTLLPPLDDALARYWEASDPLVADRRAAERPTGRPFRKELGRTG